MKVIQRLHCVGKTILATLKISIILKKSFWVSFSREFYFWSILAINSIFRSKNVFQGGKTPKNRQKSPKTPHNFKDFAFFLDFQGARGAGGQPFTPLNFSVQTMAKWCILRQLWLLTYVITPNV